MSWHPTLPGRHTKSTGSTSNKGGYIYKHCIFHQKKNANWWPSEHFYLVKDYERRSGLRAHAATPPPAPEETWDRDNNCPPISRSSPPGHRTLQSSREKGGGELRTGAVQINTGGCDSRGGSYFAKKRKVSEERRSVSQFVDFLHINRYYQAQAPGQSSGLFWVNFRSILVFCSIKSNSQLSDWSRFQEMVTPDTSPEQRTR